MTALAALSDRLFPAERIRAYVIGRIRRRRGDAPLPFRLEHRNIFVLPTLFGGGFALMLICMALGGLNFSNNMALLLVFVLAAIAQLTTVLAYRNLAGISVDSVRADPVFCGEPARFTVYLSNPDDRSRPVIQAHAGPGHDCVDVPALSAARVVLQQPTARRGWLALDTFGLETRYPLGIFRAWSWVFPGARCLVYPEPARKPPPLPRTGGGPAGLARRGEGEQVHGLREYRRGDSPRRIAWRTSARHGQLFTREMESPRDDACELRWDALAGLGAEDRLSVLTAWVLMADHRQLPFSLSLPGSSVGAGIGPAHRDRCLELLALFDR